MDFVYIFICLSVLILLIAKWHVNPFIAFLVASILGALLLGVPPERIPTTLKLGIGDLLGSLAIIICLSAMFGKLIADSGAAQQISQTLIRVAGEKYILWALLFSGFIVGVPLFYNVGFVLLVPLVFSVAYQTKLPAIYLGVPLLAALSVTHGYLQPHPSPAAMVPQVNADMGLTIIYGLIVAIPVMILAGPIFARFVRHIDSKPLETFKPQMMSDEQLPSVGKSFFVALLPIALIALASLVVHWFDKESAGYSWMIFLGDPGVVMLVILALATWILGVSRGVPLKQTMGSYASAIKDIAPILLIIAGAGALKQVFIDSGINKELADGMQSIDINPLILGWMMAALIRVCLGSATVAGLTAAGIMAPLVLANPDINPNLMVLSLGAGSMFCSHVNDSGFWMAKEYFNLSLKDTFKTWTLMETIVGLAGLVGVLLLDIWV
ncbi:MAG: gluconate transporter [Cellvibrio sp.]|nr:gluconate transporter [Cellvibrio sp.]